MRWIHWPALLCIPLFATRSPVQNQVGVGTSIARAADADRSGEVTLAEWQAWVGALASAETGAIDRDLLKAKMLAPYLDVDGDGSIRSADFEQRFPAMDSDGDGALSSEEIRSLGREDRGAGFASRLVAGEIARVADADGSGDVAAEEWAAFVRAMQAEAWDEGTQVAWVRRAEGAVPEAPGAFTLGVWLLTLDAGLDVDVNGTVTTLDLAKIFERMDADRSGTLEPGELRRSGRGAGFGGPEPWRRPNAEQRAKAPLIRWQRNLDDALALVEATGKPLLICVNMDGETASESLAYWRYRDGDFAALTEGFVPLIVSPDRHTVRDRDDRGRRIPDPRFGRVLSSEHIDIEPALYERFFDGRRVAPRHVGVDAQGKILFDIYLNNDATVIDRALAQHGKPGALRDAHGMSVKELLQSPDAAHREALEARFLAGDENVRVEIAGQALSARRTTQHPEILFMALRDGSERVRGQALAVISSHPEKVPSELIVPALNVAQRHQVEQTILVDALQRLAGADMRTQLRMRVFSSLCLRSPLINVDRWRAELPRAEAIEASAPSEDELEDLTDRLTGYESLLKADPEDVELLVEHASNLMRFAELQIEQGFGSSFALEDVRAVARRAPDDARALGYLARADYHLNLMEEAARDAARALPGLVAYAGEAHSAEVLNVLAQARTRGLYGAIEAQTEWPAHWICDITAAYDVLLDHPAANEAQALAYIQVLDVIEARAKQAAAIERALERFPSSSDLHAWRRTRILQDRGADALERAYAAGSGAEAVWYAGLASLVAAEWRIQNLEVDAGLGSYRRSVDLFGTSVDLEQDFADSANFYICLALAGCARVHTDAERWDEAVETLREGLTAMPSTAHNFDGLGNTPADTAERLLRGLEQAGREAQAADLRAALTELGVTFG